MMRQMRIEDRFKEQHSQEWLSTHTSKGNWKSYRDRLSGHDRVGRRQFNIYGRTGRVEWTALEDIGKLMKEIHRDINDEDKEAVLSKTMVQYFGSDLIRKATAGFPECSRKSGCLTAIVTLRRH